MKKSTYDKFPCIAIPTAADAAVTGWDAIAGRLRAVLVRAGATRTVVVVECYPGVDECAIAAALSQCLKQIGRAHV